MLGGLVPIDGRSIREIRRVLIHLIPDAQRKSIKAWIFEGKTLFQKMRGTYWKVEAERKKNEALRSKSILEGNRRNIEKYGNPNFETFKVDQIKIQKNNPSLSSGLRSLILDVSNLSIHPHKFIRTGIQEVQFRTLIETVRKNENFSESKIQFLTQLPNLMSRDGTAKQYFATSGEVLESVEESLRISSYDIWGFDFKKQNYQMSEDQILEMISNAEGFHLQSLYDVEPLFSQMKNRGLSIPKLSATVYDLVPVLFPEYCHDELARWARSSYLPSLAKYASEVICISRHTAIDLAEHPLTKEIPNISSLLLPFDQIEGETVFPQALLAHGLKPKSYFIYLGSIEPRKNVDQIVEGFEKFCELNTTDSTELVFVGSTGWKNYATLKKIDRSPQRHRIKRAGYLSDSDLDQTLRNAAGLVMISQYEGFGLPVAQAYARGTPVVTTRGSSMPEACLGNGIFVDPMDAVSVAKGMKKALDQSKLPTHIDPRLKERTWANYTKLLIEEILGAEK